MVTAKDVTETIESFLQYMKDANADKEVAFYGGSFTAIAKEKQEELLQAAYPYIQKGIIQRIRISTRPDAIDKDILKML